MTTDDKKNNDAAPDDDEPVVDGLPAGTTLSDTYEIVKQIGLGGMAEVYRARNIHTDEPVAIKVVLPEFARDQTNIALFKKEATVLSRLHHDAIVRYHTFTIEKSMKRPYLVMEFVDGVPLSEHLKKAPLDAQSTRILISRIAAGLSVAHKVDVIHRDLSPDNVILPDDDVGKTKIVDFGIAKAGKIGEGTLLGGKFAGKYNFVSPEQLGLAGGEVTGQSDIYSLGLIAAAAQRGKPLDMSGSQLDVLEKRRVVPDLSDIDEKLRPIVAAMLAPLPADRPKTMDDVISMLEGATEPPVPAPKRAPVRPPAPLEDTGTVFGAEMPYQPVAAVDPWADGRPAERTFPPQPQSPPQPPPQHPPQGSWPPAGEASQPPESSWHPNSPMDRSVPPGPPPFTPAPADNGFSERSTPPKSESPFGPGPTAPPTFGKTQGKKAKTKKGGGGGGLFVVLGLVVLLLGGGAVFFMQGGFGLLSPAPEEVTPIPPDVPVVTPPDEETIVADIPEPTPTPTPTPTPPSTVVTGAAARVAWLADYDFSACEYAAPITVADNAMQIEGFGSAVQPFEQMMSDFEKDNGFEPDVQVRLILDPQCAVADFLRATRPLSIPGPTLALSTDTLASGGTLQGTLRDVAGWSTDLLLIDYRGGVQNLSVFMSTTEGGSAFALPPLLSKATEPVPMMIVAISTKGGLNNTRLVRTHEAKQIFPVIQREIESRDSEVSISVKFFKLGGAEPG